MEFFNSFFSDSKSHDENAIWKKQADIASANNRALLIVQEPWSSGYGRRLMYWRPWVRIPALYNGWTFFKSICRKNCIDACLKIKRGQRWPILKQFSSHLFWRWDTSRCPCKPFRRWRRRDEPSDPKLRFEWNAFSRKIAFQNRPRQCWLPSEQFCWSKSLDNNWLITTKSSFIT